MILTAVIIAAMIGTTAEEVEINGNMTKMTKTIVTNDKTLIMNDKILMLIVAVPVHLLLVLYPMLKKLHAHLSALTVARIHWQALRLWLKGAPFHSKPEMPQNAWRTHHG